LALLTVSMTDFKRDAIERHAARVGGNPDFLRTAADDEGEANILDFRQFRLQFLGDQIERLIIPAVSGGSFRRKRNDDDRNVADAAPDDQRLGNAGGNLVVVGADALVDAQDGVVAIRADLEAGRDKDAVILSLAVDMLDAVDGFDDGLKRLGDQFGRIRRLEAVGATAMSTIGTLICGSSSRGIVNSASRPSAIAVSRKSGVSGERMVASVSLPEMPSFTTRAPPAG
jgi:hypothetical protein